MFREGLPFALLSRDRHEPVKRCTPAFLPMFQRYRLACLTAVASFLAGCAVGPDYVRPPFEAPAAYKEPGPWKAAEPRQIDADQQWWKQYGDTRLDALIDEANKANQDIRLAEAQYRQARGVADAARSGYYPTVTANASAGRGRTISNGTTNLGNTASVSLVASWEPDLWGSVRRSVEAGTAGAQACMARSARSSNVLMSSPCSAAGTIPKYESAE